MQVTEHVHAVKIPFQVRSPAGRTIDRFVYLYLIFGEKICLIDSGVAGSERVIFDYVRKTGRTPEEIAMIVQTHAHPDHIGATQAIKNATGCVVAAHRAEKVWIEDVELQFKERPIPNFHSLVGGSTEVDRILEDGDVLDLDGGLRLEVFHTPGHSKGSISLLLHEDKVLFSGDALPCAGDLPIYEDVIASVNSVKELKGIKGIQVLLSSWDAPCEGARVYTRIDDGLQYLQRIHEVVIKVAGESLSQESKEFCQRVLAELGLPLMAANPLVCRSFETHLQVRDHRDLLREK